MRCREIVRLINYGRDAEPAVQFEMTQHAFCCEKCREELATNSIIKSILKSYTRTDDEHSAWEEVRLLNQVRARIQSAKESGLGNWESAVISARGWLVGFAAAAILLLALSGQLAASNSAYERDESRADQISSAIAPLTDDLISSNTQVNSPDESDIEEVENVR